MKKYQFIEEEISSDPFYSPSNLKRLEESTEQLKNGKIVHKTMEELEAMEMSRNEAESIFLQKMKEGEDEIIKGNTVTSEEMHKLLGI